MCPVKEIFEYAFDDVTVDARCWFDMYVGNGFFTVYFELIFVVNGVSNVNLQKIRSSVNLLIRSSKSLSKHPHKISTHSYTQINRTLLKQIIFSL